MDLTAAFLPSLQSKADPGAEPSEGVSHIFFEAFGSKKRYGDGSKNLIALVNIKSAGRWMFIQ